MSVPHDQRTRQGAIVIQHLRRIMDLKVEEATGFQVNVTLHVRKVLGSWTSFGVN